MTEPVRVLLVDDQTLVRQGIRSLLAIADGVDVVGEAGDGEEALTRIAELRPDVVLLDLRMPRLDGIGVLRSLQDKELQPPVLVLTTFDDDELVLDSLRLGAKGYLLKDVSLEELVTAIETLAAGGEIASALHLAEGTVKNHVSSLLLKLGVRDRTRAVLKGIELGLVGGAGRP